MGLVLNCVACVVIIASRFCCLIPRVPERQKGLGAWIQARFGYIAASNRNVETVNIYMTQILTLQNNWTDRPDASRCHW